MRKKEDKTLKAVKVLKEMFSWLNMKEPEIKENFEEENEWYVEINGMVSVSFYEGSYGVEKFVYAPGVRYHRDGSGTPPDIDVVEIHTGLSSCFDACRKAFELFIELSLDEFAINYDYEQQSEEWKEVWG